MNHTYTTTINGIGYVVIARDTSHAAELVFERSGDPEAYTANYTHTDPANSDTSQEARVVATLRPARRGSGSQALLYGYNDAQADVILARAALQAQEDKRRRFPHDPDLESYEDWEARYPINEAREILARAEYSLCEWGFSVVMADPQLAALLKTGCDLRQEWLHDSPVWRHNRLAVVDVFLALKD